MTLGISSADMFGRPLKNYIINEVFETMKDLLMAEDDPVVLRRADAEPMEIRHGIVPHLRDSMNSLFYSQFNGLLTLQPVINAPKTHQLNIGMFLLDGNPEGVAVIDYFGAQDCNAGRIELAKEPYGPVCDQSRCGDGKHAILWIPGSTGGLVFEGWRNAIRKSAEEPVVGTCRKKYPGMPIVGCPGDRSHVNILDRAGVYAGTFASQNHDEPASRLMERVLKNYF